ncbi:betaine/proline/choline family ABC transporter ATP-binding protein [Ilumatobacter sp.]|uniref:betaine/proline/choline family ABC transporter ATP-binding protein n=1 Tax=Ilumatobacter sp. TaxID=1967498 RepID=UPI003752F5EA
MPDPTSQPDIAIRLTGVTKEFDGAASAAVDDLSLDIESGTIMALLGPSGCGKTTTLRMINRLIEPTAGMIEINGVDVMSQSAQELRRGIGYVIQQVGLFPHRTIASNIATVPTMLGWEKSRSSARVEELIALVGLDHELLNRYPDELSGGQQQRVGVARALAADPPVLLMDEPFGAVDPIVRGRLQEELLDLQTKVSKTIVLVTHDVDEALRVADTIALMNVGGVVEQLATPDELMRAPANDFVKSFVGEDRGLRRLALNTVSALRFHQGPVVDVAAAFDDAERAISTEGTDWLGITIDGRFAGWTRVNDVSAARTNGTTLADVQRFDPIAQIEPSSTLHAAMELIMSSNSSVAVINDSGNYGGVVTLEDIRRALSSADIETADGTI